MTTRCFLAISIPEDVRSELMNLQMRLKGFSSLVAWTRPESLHLTLKFFGDVRNSDLPTLRQTLLPIAAECNPLTLTVGKLGAFPSFRKPRVFWVGIQDEDVGSLSDLAERIEVAGEQQGYPREERSFQPHLTLGRSKAVDRFTQLVEEMQRCSDDYFAGSFIADHLTLYQSVLQPAGAVYKPLAVLPFHK